MTEFKKGQEWNKPLTEDMKDFEAETGKKSVWNGKITGMFEHWLWKKKHPKTNKKTKPLDWKVQEIIEYLAGIVGHDNVKKVMKIDEYLPEEFGTGYLYTFYTRKNIHSKWLKEYTIGFCWDDDKKEWVEY